MCATPTSTTLRPCTCEREFLAVEVQHAITPGVSYARGDATAGECEIGVVLFGEYWGGHGQHKSDNHETSAHTIHLSALCVLVE